MKKSVMLIFLCIGILQLFGAFLTKMPKTIVQPDGTVFKCFTSGDEFHHWLHDEDNYTIIQNPETGEYVWAIESNGSVVASHYRVDKINPSQLGIAKGINLSKEKYLEKRNRYLNTMRENPTRAPNQGTINNIIVFIRFSDQTEFGENISVYDNMLNASTPTSNSMKNYFNEVSYQTLAINSTFYPSASNNMVISYQDTYPRNYFLPYSASNTNGYQNDEAATSREHALLKRAVLAIASSVPSNLNIDGDNDGYVDNVCFIVKGDSGDWADLLWPHRWVLYSENVYINSKRVWDYNFQLQTFLASAGASVLAHEMFHSLGAPDLYRYVNEGDPIGPWDLMASNTNPPQHMSAFMKKRYGTWISNIPLISSSGTYTINSIKSTTNNCYRINSPNSSSEYFVVEFRKNNNGIFDSELSGSGLLVYRVNTFADGEGNAQGPPDELYVYRPNGTTTSDGNINDAYFSLESGRIQINDATNPSSFLSNGAPSGLQIYNIGTSAGNTISFNVMFESPNITIPHTENFDTGITIPNLPLGWVSIASNSGDESRPWITQNTANGANSAPNFANVYYSAYYPKNEWMISPAVTLTAGMTYQVRFMVKAPGWGGVPEKMKLVVGTSQALSGMTNGTILWNDPNMLYSNYTEKTATFTPSTTGNYYFGWHAYSVTDVDYIRVDDISFEMLQTHFPPTNLTANSGNAVVNLSWDAPATGSLGTLASYNVYRNNTLLTNVPIPAQIYADNNVTNGTTYNYYVTAVYSNPLGESVASNTVDATPFVANLNPPINLTGSVNNDDVTLNWQSPANISNWISHASETYNDAIGTNGAAQFSVAQRFTSEQLQALGMTGAQITKIRFKAHYSPATYTVKVWTGGSGSPYASGSVATSQAVVAINVDDWTEVILNTPVSIPANTEVWFGYDINTPGNYPAGVDAGPALNGYGNLIYWQNAWTTLTALSASLNYNWIIQAYVVGGTGRSSKYISAMDQQDQVPLLANNLETNPFKAVRVYPQRQQRNDRSLLGFNVYRGTTLLTPTMLPTTTLTYNDLNLANGNYTYNVTAVYSEGESTPASITLNVGVDAGTIINFPWNEGFEGATFPPAFWSNIDADGDNNLWISYAVTNAAHSGTKSAASASYLNSQGPLTPNNWLITPKIALPVYSAGQSANLKFWIAAQDPAWPNEHYSVLISTTNTNITSFTNVLSETLVNGTWIQKTISLSNYSGQNIYIAFRHHDSTDMFYIKLDDVSVELTNPVVFNPPRNLTAQAGNAIVNLNWSAPLNRALSGYKVFRNGILITNTPITTTSYSDNTVTNGVTYNYYVTALYSNPNGESAPSNTVSATPTAPLLNPPRNLSAVLNDNDVTLSWLAPNPQLNLGLADHVMTRKMQVVLKEKSASSPFSQTEQLLSERTDRSLLGYKVYRGTTLLTTTILPTTILTYIDLDLANGNYTYNVTAVYTEGESAPVSVNIYVNDNTGGISSFPWNEGFEGTTFPPDYWSNIDADGDNNLWFSYSAAGSAHSGSKSAASASWNSSSALTPNNWLITPRIILPVINPEDTANLKFWVAAQDPDWANEHYSVLISTTNTNPSSFTSILSETLQNSTWNEKTIPLNNYSNQSIYIAFRHHECTDMFYMKIDDVSVTLSNAQGFNPPQNLTAQAGNAMVTLNWTAPANRVLSAYKVFRNGVLLTNTPATSTTYTDNTVTNGVTYNYFVTALYSNPNGESVASNTVSATPNLPVLNPPVNLTGIANANNVTLNWFPPGSDIVENQWITHADEVYNDAIGTNAAAQFTVAQRFTPDQLNSLGVVGGQLNSIRFMAHVPEATYTVKVWTGGTGTPYSAGTVAASQVVPVINVDDWTEITLSSPVLITGNEELWIGYDVNTPSGYPAGVDAGPALNGYGNLMYYEGEWTTLLNLASTLDYNWIIQGFVSGSVLSASSDVQLHVISDPINPDHLKKTPLFHSIDVVRSHSSSRNLLGYKVYRGTTLLTPTPLPTTTLSYIDSGLSSGLYTYNVTALYTDGESLPATVSVNVTVGSEIVTVAKTSLGKNYPNPFNPSTSIAYSLDQRSLVKIEILNIKGQKIRTLVNQFMDSGEHTIVWNGKDDNNNDTGSGIYFYKMTTPNYSSTGKMILVK